METTTVDKLMNILLILSAMMILIGAFFKLQHYPYGSNLLTYGFLAQFLISGFEIRRLKKVILELKKNKI